METDKPLVLMNQEREPAAKGPMKSLVASGMHYIRDGDGLEELYVLESDPKELVNFAGASDVQAALQRFRNTLSSMRKRGSQ